MPTPPVSNLLLWFSADQGVALDGSGRVASWDNRQSGLPSLSQPNSASRPVLVPDIFNGFPGIQFSDGTFLDAQGLGISGADFTLFVLGRTLSEQSPRSGPGASGRRFVFQQTLSRNIQGDTRPFLVAISVGSNGMALYELDLDDVPRAISLADMSVLCPLTVEYRESLPLASLCSQSFVQPSVVTGYQIGMGSGANNGFDGIVVELLLYQGTLSASDRGEVETYLQEKYLCCESSASSSDSSSSDSSDSSSSESSDSSDSSSSESSDSSSSDSSDSSSSSCDFVLPPDPTPVTEGLVAWYRSDINVAQNGNLVTVWGAVCDCLPDAVSIGGTPPLITDSMFGAYPGISFDSQQGLQIQGGELADDSFTMFVIGRATGERTDGGSGTDGQRLLFYQSGDGGNAWPSVSVGKQSIGVYEYGPGDSPRVNITTDAEVLCPLVTRYENKQLSVYLRGEIVYQDFSTPGYALHLAHFIGGTGDVSSGFIGTLAEIIFYNRALSDTERQQVESYLQTRYGCLPTSSDSSESSSSESSDSSDSSSSDSSDSSSSDSSESESSEQSDDSSDSSSPAEIKRDEDQIDGNWQSVAGELARALPGQKINLRLELASGPAPTDLQWILPSKVFKDYTANAANGELIPIGTNDLNQEVVSFYWADSGTKVVKVKYKHEGVPGESEVTIEVAKPTTSLTATGSETTVGTIDNSPGPYLYVLGVNFTGTVSVPAQFGVGKWAFMQLVTMNCSAKADSSQDDPSVRQDGGTYYDGISYPYAGEVPFDTGTTHGAEDLPNFPLRTNYRQYAVHFPFTMYLMFTPPGSASKPVPLVKLPWSWEDAAIYDPEADPLSPWKKDPLNGVQVETSSETSAHPTWTDSAQNHTGWN